MPRCRKIQVTSLYKMDVDKLKGVCRDTVMMFKILKQQHYHASRYSKNKERQKAIGKQWQEVARQLKVESSMPIRMNSWYKTGFYRYNARPVGTFKKHDCFPRACAYAMQEDYKVIFGNIANLFVKAGEADPSNGDFWVKKGRLFAKTGSTPHEIISTGFMDIMGWEMHNFGRNSEITINDCIRDGYKTFIARTPGHVGAVNGGVLVDLFDWRFEWYANRARETRITCIWTPPKD